MFLGGSLRLNSLGSRPLHMITLALFSEGSLATCQATSPTVGFGHQRNLDASRRSG